MNEDLEKNNIDKELQPEVKPSASNDNFKASEKNLSCVDDYNNILKKRIQSENFYRNLFAAIICIVILLAVFLNVYLVETEKYDQNLIRIQQEKIARQKQEELDRIKLMIAQKNKESSDLVIFNDKYLSIRTKFYNDIKAISVKAEEKSNSLADIIKVTEDRIKIAKDYKSKLNNIAIPSPLANFYKYELEFIDSDIRLWEIANAYYALNDLSKFDTDKIYEESIKSHALFLKAQEELKDIYTKYELDYFLKEIIINYQ